jgi:hypothetical protein
VGSVSAAAIIIGVLSARATRSLRASIPGSCRVSAEVRVSSVLIRVFFDATAQVPTCGCDRPGVGFSSWLAFPELVAFAAPDSDLLS